MRKGLADDIADTVTHLAAHLDVPRVRVEAAVQRALFGQSDVPLGDTLEERLDTLRSVLERA